jgi:hypothetical protein
MASGRRAAVVALAATGLAGCGSWFRPSPVTMDLLFDDRACQKQAPVLLVLLPGANMSPAEMLAQGMVQAVRERAWRWMWWWPTRNSTTSTTAACCSGCGRT